LEQKKGKERAEEYGVHIKRQYGSIANDEREARNGRPTRKKPIKEHVIMKISGKEHTERSERTRAKKKPLVLIGGEKGKSQIPR